MSHEENKGNEKKIQKNVRMTSGKGGSGEEVSHFWDHLGMRRKREKKMKEKKKIKGKIKKKKKKTKEKEIKKNKTEGNGEKWGEQTK